MFNTQKTELTLFIEDLFNSQQFALMHSAGAVVSRKGNPYDVRINTVKFFEKFLDIDDIVRKLDKHIATIYYRTRDTTTIIGEIFKILTTIMRYTVMPHSREPEPIEDGLLLLNDKIRFFFFSIIELNETYAIIETDYMSRPHIFRLKTDVDTFKKLAKIVVGHCNCDVYVGFTRRGIITLNDNLTTTIQKIWIPDQTTGKLHCTICDTDVKFDFALDPV